MIYNYQLEQHLIAGLIKNPNSFVEISPFISEKDFFSDSSLLNKSLFFVIRNFIESGENLDEILISEKIKSLGINFEGDVDILEYIQSICLRKVSPNSVIDTAKELKKLTLRRDLSNAGSSIHKAMKRVSKESYQEIIDSADKIYNEIINSYESEGVSPMNIYDDLEELIEERGNNPIDNFGLEGPHRRLHQIYGSLLRPGNITVIVARSGVGKTQFCMDFCTKTSTLNDNIPVLHFDNGEMSKEELQMRQCASISGVPLSLLETGRWRNAGEDIVTKVRKAFPKVKKMQFYYYNCGGMSVDEMVNVLRRFYYSKVGRGNQMIFSFDYIKTTFESGSTKNEWQIVGEMVDKFKKVIQKEIIFENSPVISMITSVQMNRLGTSRNRQSENIVEDETVVSLSDRITQFCSHMFLLRRKEPSEVTEHLNYGNHKLVCLKARHLGQDPQGEIEPVRMADGSLRRNFMNFDFENFNITERGDLRDLVDHLRIEGISPNEDGEDSLPSLFNE
jgi:replicative DNA helicase